MAHYVYYCTMRSINAYVLFFLFIAGTSSCKENYDAPCRAVAYESISFTASEKSWLAYTKADTLTYERLPSSSLRNGFVIPEASTWARMPRAGSNPECPPDSIQYEQLNFTLKLDSNFHTLHIRFDKRNSELTCSSDSGIFRFPFSSLSSPDSVFMTAANWSGRAFSGIYMRTSNNDSLYYTKTDGVIRYMNSTSVFQLQ
jgi:hypothetical protein